MVFSLAPPTSSRTILGPQSEGEHTCLHTVNPAAKRSHRPISSLQFDAHELSYLGYDAVLDVSPHTGGMLIWQLDMQAPAAGAAPLLTPPLSGSTWHTPYRRVAYLGLDVWLEFAPSSGAYALHRCSHERWRHQVDTGRLCRGLDAPGDQRRPVIDKAPQSS